MSGLTVAVHGLGYVGTVTSACLAAHGHHVIGVDIDGDKVDRLNAGMAPVLEPGLDAVVREGRRAGSLEALAHDPLTMARLVGGSDVHLVCVGTPSQFNGSPDIGAVASVTENLVAVFDRLRSTNSSGPDPAVRPTIVIRSTVPPGTIDELGERLDRTYGVTRDVDYGLAMCPEFLREGSALEDFHRPPFTVAGVADSRSEDVLRRLFAFTGGPFHAVSIRTAETIKYACNAFHATKIAFANEIGRFAEASGADGRTVMDIVCEDRVLNISPAYLRPGFAFGGSCLPKDLRALVQRGRHLDVDLPLLGSVLPSNDAHLDQTVGLLLAHRPSTVGILGLTFKAGTDDLRESPYVRVAETLIGRGIEVAIWDGDLDTGRLRGGNRRFVDERLPHLARLLEPTPEAVVARADVCLVGSADPAVTAALAHHSVPVVDSAGCLRPVPAAAEPSAEMVIEPIETGRAGPLVIGAVP